MFDKIKDSSEFVLDYFKNLDDFYWLELDIDFDLESAQEELSNIDKFYVPHRESGSYNGHQGWSSCTLHGLGTQITENWNKYHKEMPKHDWTELSLLCPTMTDFWKNRFPAERFNRIRFMKLEASGYILPHNDHDPQAVKNYNIFEDGIAVNLAITHPKGCEFKFNDKNIPWAPGKLFMINVSKVHEVVNNSDKDRIHMIAHAWIGNKRQEFSDLIIRSLKKNENI